MLENVLISVITVCFNAEKTIKRTLKSVLRQEGVEFEYVIVDGNSSDATLKIIDAEVNLAQKNVRVISEPDKGIYDAMNKGVRLAHGKYVIFMNAGDAFFDSHTLETIKLNIRSEDDVLYGDHYAVLGNRRRLHPATKKNGIGRYLFCHQASVTRRKLLLEMPFDTKYRILADSDFFDKQYMRGRVFHYLSCPLAYFDLDGVSTKCVDENREEQRKIGNSMKFSACRIKKYMRSRISCALPLWIRSLRYKKFSDPWSS